MAVAVPDVQTKAAGMPLLKPVPREKKAAPRSSRIEYTFIFGWAAKAMVSGVDLDPGAITAVVIPLL